MRTNIFISKFPQIIIAVLLLSMFSCASKADLVYFQDESLNNFNQPVINPEIKYQPDDMLTINVTNLDPDAVRPFNLPAVSFFSNAI